FEARSAYYTLEKEHGLLVVALETEKQYADRAAEVRERVKAGTLPPFDFTKARLDHANARLSAVRARKAVRDANASLASASGLAEPTSWEPGGGRPLASFGLTLEEATAEAAAKHPSIGAARAREEGASSVVDAEVRALLPSISLQSSWSAAG